MWRKIAIGIGLFLLLTFVAAYIFVPRIAEHKLRKLLENADSASFTTLEINFWDGNVELRNVYVLDSSGNLANQPVKLALDLISIRGFKVFKLLKENIAEVDSIIIGKGSVTLPLFHKDSNRLAPKGDAKFLQQIAVNHVFLDSIDVDLSLNPNVKSQRIRGTVIFKADEVAIPLVEDARLGWTGSLALHALSVNDSLGKLTRMPLQLELNSLRLIGLDANDLQAHGTAKADSILIGKGWASLILAEAKDSLSDTTKIAQQFLNSIQLNFFKADSLSFVLGLNPKNTKEQFKTSLICEASNIIIPLQKNAPLAYSNLQLRLSDLYLLPHKSIAYYTLEQGHYNSMENSIELNGFKMRQSISELRYAKHFGWDKAFVKLDVFKIVIAGIPNKLAQLNDGINVDKITVLGAQAYFYKDKRLPHPNKPRPFPVEALSALKIPVHVREVLVTDGQLFYNENWREDYVPGRLNLSDIDLVITNISSTGPTKQGKWTIVKGNILMLDQLKLDVDWRFDLRTKGKSFTLDLGIGACTFESLNPFTENTVGVHFKKGDLQGGRLLVSGDKTSGSGTLDLFYKSMKVELLDKQTHHTGFVEWAGGGLANLVVRNNNLKNKKPQQGIVYAEPIPDRDVFAFIVKLFFAGFKDIAVGSKNQQKIEQGKKP